MIKTGLFTNRSWDIPEEIKYNKQTNTEMNKIEPNNIDEICSGEINGYTVSLYHVDDIWDLAIVESDTGALCGIEYFAFEKAIEGFNIEVNYIREHGKLRDTWTEEEE